MVAGLFSFPSLAERGGYRLVFLAAAGAALAVGLANLAQGAVRHHLPVHEPQSFPVLIRRSARMALNRRLLLLVVVNIGASGIIVGLIAWTPSFLHDTHGTGLAAAAYVSAGIGVAQLIGNPLGARAMVRWGKGPIYIVSLAVMAAAAAMIPFVGSFAVALVCILAAGFFSMAVFPAILGGVPDTAHHPEDIGPGTGFLNLTNMVGTLLAPWLFGVLLDAFGTGPEQFGFKSGYLLLALFALIGVTGGDRAHHRVAGRPAGRPPAPPPRPGWAEARPEPATPGRRRSPAGDAPPPPRQGQRDDPHDGDAHPDQLLRGRNVREHHDTRRWPPGWRSTR